MNHDQNSKNLILDYPHQALAFFAAEEAADQLADAEIFPARQEQLKDRLGDRFRELDVPLLVQWPDGRREAQVPRFTLFFALRAPQMCQGKAQRAGNSPSLAKRCNAALAHLGGSESEK